jgi:hypothetical protein
VQAEAGGQHPVVRRRRAAALHVPEHRRPRLLAGARLDLALEQLTDPPSRTCPKASSSASRVAMVPLLGHAPLGDDEDRRVVLLEAALDVAAHLVDVERAAPG